MIDQGHGHVGTDAPRQIPFVSIILNALASSFLVGVIVSVAAEIWTGGKGDISERIAQLIWAIWIGGFTSLIMTGFCAVFLFSPLTFICMKRYNLNIINCSIIGYICALIYQIIGDYFLGGQREPSITLGLSLLGLLGGLIFWLIAGRQYDAAPQKPFLIVKEP